MRRARRGFSLLEAIVGVAIATAFLGAISFFVVQIGDARARLARMSSELECAEAVFGLCERALATAVIESPDGAGGVAGTERMLRVTRAGVGLGEGGASLLADLEQITIAHDGAGSVSISRGTDSDTLHAEVRQMRVRFLASDGWVDAFDSAREEQFPSAIEVSLWFGAPRADEDAVDTLEATAILAAPDRTRVFRIVGAPRVDPLATRAIRKERAQ